MVGYHCVSYLMVVSVRGRSINSVEDGAVSARIGELSDCVELTGHLELVQDVELTHCRTG
jgi:hypothetical protein